MLSLYPVSLFRERHVQAKGANTIRTVFGSEIPHITSWHVERYIPIPRFDQPTVYLKSYKQANSRLHIHNLATATFPLSRNRRRIRGVNSEKGRGAIDRRSKLKTSTVEIMAYSTRDEDTSHTVAYVSSCISVVVVRTKCGERIILPMRSAANLG